MESIAFYRNLIDKVFPVMECFKGVSLEEGLQLVQKRYSKEKISNIAFMAYQDANIFQNIGKAFKDEVMESKPTKEQMKGFLDAALFELSSIGYGWKEQHYINFVGGWKLQKEDRGLLKDIDRMACYTDIQTGRLLDSIEEVAVYTGYELPKWWYKSDGNVENKENLNDYQKECFRKLINNGYMCKNGDGYKWNKTKALLAYAMEKIFCKNNSDKFPETMLNGLFGVTRLGQARSQLYNSSNPPRGANRIDDLCL